MGVSAHLARARRRDDGGLCGHLGHGSGVRRSIQDERRCLMGCQGGRHRGGERGELRGKGHAGHWGESRGESGGQDAGHAGNWGHAGQVEMS